MNFSFLTINQINMKRISLCSFFALAILFSACKNGKDKKEETMKEPKLKEETVSYELDSVTRNNYLAYDDNIEGKRPVVLVFPEWWGLNEFTKGRARELAKLGYMAMAVDMYGDGKMGTDPKLAGELSGPFYANPGLVKPIFDAALNKLRTYSQSDMDHVGAIGYCFGGSEVLNLAKMGEDLKGVVSFHGNLNVMPPAKDKLKAEVLVCHGEADSFVPMTEVETFKKQMDSVGAKYAVKLYPGATHAFTNPEATEVGKKFNLPVQYNAAADTASWSEMKSFFNRVLH
jgi:dienelactone hydrolase